jgi:hypothetical protein
VRNTGEGLFAGVDKQLVTCWMDEASLTNQISEEPSGKSHVKCCKTDPQ